MLAQVLWDDLNFEREFDMIPRDVYKSVPVARSPEQVPFGAWREIGADGVFFGTVEQTGNDMRISGPAVQRSHPDAGVRSGIHHRGAQRPSDRP